MWQPEIMLPPKVDYDPLELRLTQGEQQWTLAQLEHSDSASLSYGQAQYERTSGLLSVSILDSLKNDNDFQDALRGDGILKLVGTKDGKDIDWLVEVPLVVKSDDRCRYILDWEEPH